MYTPEEIRKTFSNLEGLTYSREKLTYKYFLAKKEVNKNREQERRIQKEFL